MNKTEFKLEQLINLIDGFIENFNNGIWVAKEKYEETLINIFHKLLHDEAWDVETFLSIVIGAFFWSKIIEQARVKQGKISQNENHSVIESLDISDIKRSKKDLIIVYHKKMKLLNECPDKNIIGKKNKPVFWVGLFSNYCIEIKKNIIEEIRLAYFGLNLKEAMNGRERDITFDENEAAIFLSKEFGYDISARNVLEFSLKKLPYSFNVYLDRERYNVIRTFTSPMPRSVYSIDKALNNGSIDHSYKYHYEGLVRIVKKYPADVGGCLTKQTAKHIRDGGVIVIDKDFPFIKLHTSLSDLVLGIEENIKGDNEKITIASKDLRYVKSELVNFLDQYLIDNQRTSDTEQTINNINSSEASTGKISEKEIDELWKDVENKFYTLSNKIQKGNKMNLIIEALHLVIATIKKINPTFDAMKIPGSVQDFYHFCLRLRYAVQIFPEKKHTFRKYCRGTINKNMKQPSLCDWSKTRSPDPEYWDKIRPHKQTYIVNTLKS